MDFYPAKEDRLIHEARSGINHIKVFDKINGFRYMLLNGVQQGGNIPETPWRLIIPYCKGAFAALGFIEMPRDFLFVGLGIGAMPLYMRKLKPSARIDVVEIDPQVVVTAKGWFGFEEDEKLRVHIGDGRKFVQSAPRSYDAVFLDAYHNTSVPSHLSTLEFMYEVKAILKPGGVAVFNLWGESANPLFGASVRTLQESFAELYQFRTLTSNYIFVADTKNVAMDKAEVMERAKKLKKKSELDFNLEDLIKRNYKRMTETELHADSLHDGYPNR